MRKTGAGMGRGVVRVAVAAGLSTWALTGCNGFFVPPGTTTTTPTGSAATSYAYVANATTMTVAGFGVGSGTLTTVANSPYALPIAPTSLVVTPSNTFLYVGSLGAIYGYSIASSGQLTPLSGGAALAAAGVVSMDVSPDGGWLLALDANGVSVDEFQINASTGLLTPANGASFAVTGGVTLPRALRFAPSGALVFAAMGTGGDVVFTFNTSTGALVASQTLAGSAVSSDNAVAIDANSAVLYIARSGTGAGVAVYLIGPGGALTSVAGSPFAAGTAPYALALSATGANLYAANRSDGTVSGFSVASGGVLTALNGSPYASGALVSSLGRDSTGKYLLAAAFGGSSDLTMYSFDANVAGKLDVATTVNTGTDPTGAIAVAMTH